MSELSYIKVVFIITRKILITAVFIALNNIAVAQDSLLVKYASTISKNELWEHVKILSSETFEGRETGKNGQHLAADYISTFFLKTGIAAFSNKKQSGYHQAFSLKSKAWNDLRIISSSGEFELYKDFYIFRSFPEKLFLSELVFAGYGLDSDYDNIDVQNKISVVLPGFSEKKPSLFHQNQIITTNTGIFQKYKTAQKYGAKAIMLVMENHWEYLNFVRGYSSDFYITDFTIQDETDTEIAALITTVEKGAKMLGISKKRFKRGIKKKRRNRLAQTEKISGKINIIPNFKTYNLKTENIIGFVEGRDLSHEFIVVSAHYDHLGKDEGGTYYGADDNASGTGTLLELAEAFQKASSEGNGPRRSILFVAFSGEEKGLFGSEYFINNPPVDLHQLKLNINIDMIGRTDFLHTHKTSYISGPVFISTGLFEFAGGIISQYLPDFDNHLQLNLHRVYGGSDHYHFARNGIPAISFFQGIHADYHKTSDTMEKIDFERMTKISRMIFALCWELANRDNIPKADNNKQTNYKDIIFRK